MAKHVLVVDDDPQVSDLLGEILSRGGYATHAVATCAAALAELRQVAFDAVLVDLGLPGREGWQLLERLRAEPVALAASSADADEATLATSFGARGRLLKPFGVSNVLQLLDRLTSSS